MKPKSTVAEGVHPVDIRELLLGVLLAQFLEFVQDHVLLCGNCSLDDCWSILIEGLGIDAEVRSDIFPRTKPSGTFAMLVAIVGSQICIVGEGDWSLVGITDALGQLLETPQ